MNTGSMWEKTGNDPDVLVLGGGAAGMMAALQAGRSGARTALLEKNEKLGKKIYITGKGRCNASNTADLQEFLRQTPRNPRFLHSALNAFDHEDLTALLASLGTPTKVERGGRIFPMSDHASDVTRALAAGMREAGVKVLLQAEAKEAAPCGPLWQVRLSDGRAMRARALVIATGGLSYPSTGSTGDGYAFARALGHTVTPLRPSLVGFDSGASWPGLLQGLTLKNVRLTASLGGKKLYSELGEMLFTHFGFSGPLMIELSAHLPDEWAQPELRLDLKPGLTPEQTDLRLQRELAESPKRQLSSVLQALLPARMAPVFAELCGLDPAMPASGVTRAARQALLAGFKGLPLPVSGLRPYTEAVVTRGGVSVREVAPGTMGSRLHPGLFFAGELLDVDAHTGGFNLQIAFSTGALAGRSAAAYALDGAAED